ncbi:MAG: PrsW family intramembrane metalloprotease [Clostridiales bacterium]|nr:PrsW family intramembrane metalloprotease [Clostridiales bacterium]
MILLLAAIAPSAALMYYFYMRDKYEKEPRHLLTKAFLLGAISVIPILIVEMKLNLFDMGDKRLIAVGYTAFIVAGLVEEAFKFLMFYILIWNNDEFNEMYDGIVYSVFISLGFATVENIAYVLSTGFSVALLRAITAVPAHALFGVAMGYYLGISKFAQQPYKIGYFLLGLFIPIVLHGVYDFILLSHRYYITTVFFFYMIYLWKRGMRKVKTLIANSPYKDYGGKEDD